jgi:hypothetical protein
MSHEMTRRKQLKDATPVPTCIATRPQRLSVGHDDPAVHSNLEVRTERADHEGSSRLIELVCDRLPWRITGICKGHNQTIRIGEQRISAWIRASGRHTRPNRRVDILWSFAWGVDRDLMGIDDPNVLRPKRERRVQPLGE